MFIRLIISFSLMCLASAILAPAAFCAPIDDWNAIILEGSKHKIDGRYDLAGQSFTKALSCAEKQKLPDKCLPISLCRLAEVEIINNNVKEGDAHFDQIVNLIKTQKATRTLDPQVNFWAAALSDAYQGNHKPDTQELCLKHACYLKTLVYGAIHRECTDCLAKLAEYYIKENKMDKAVTILEFDEGLLAKIDGKNPDRLGDNLHELALKREDIGKYNQVELLESAVIKMARKNTTSLRSGLPVFYLVLDMNALVQNKRRKSDEYFQKALEESRKIKDTQYKESINKYLWPLPSHIWKIFTENNKNTIKTICEHLLAVHKTLNTSREQQYDLLSRLSSLESGTKQVEMLKTCIDTAENAHSDYKHTLPDLYMRLAGCSVLGHDLSQATKLYNHALELETEKEGCHVGWLYYFWGCLLERIGENKLAMEKLSTAFNLASKLSPEKRGSLLVNLLATAANNAREHNDQRSAHELYKQLHIEEQLQKRLKSHPSQ